MFCLKYSVNGDITVYDMRKYFVGYGMGMGMSISIGMAMGRTG